MEYGPDEEEPESPALPPELRVKVPRSSLRYLLLHRLKFRYGFAKKKPAFSDPVKRHRRVGGAQVVQAAQEDIQVAAAHVGGGNDGAEPGDEAVHGVEVAVMADA
jgi:hypothetical protein